MYVFILQRCFYLCMCVYVSVWVYSTSAEVSLDVGVTGCCGPHDMGVGNQTNLQKASAL